MQLQTKTVRQGINKAYLKRADLDGFKEEATAYLNNLDQAKGKVEEHHKAKLHAVHYELYGLSEEEIEIVEGECGVILITDKK